MRTETEISQWYIHPVTPYPIKSITGETTHISLSDKPESNTQNQTPDFQKPGRDYKMSQLIAKPDSFNLDRYTLYFRIIMLTANIRQSLKSFTHHTMD
jgi:hypothetical protein